MPLFKVGDKVRCIKASNAGYPGIVGKVYTVIGVTTDTGDQHIYLETDEPCAGLGCQSDRFESANSAVDQWFDEKLADKSEKKKERVPDELDWEKHKAFMRSLR